MKEITDTGYIHWGGLGKLSTSGGQPITCPQCKLRDRAIAPGSGRLQTYCPKCQCENQKQKYRAKQEAKKNS